LQVVGKHVEGQGRDRSARRGGVMLGNPTIDLGDAFERPVPARFEFAGHQPVLRVGGVVLAERTIGGVAGGLEVAQERLAGLVPARRRLGSASRAAWIAAGWTTESSAASTASSTRRPPKAMQEGSP
jgi:hypothetical protein